MKYLIDHMPIKYNHYGRKWEYLYHGCKDDPRKITGDAYRRTVSTPKYLLRKLVIKKADNQARTYRKKRGHTQNDVAKYCGLNNKTVLFFEVGQSPSRQKYTGFTCITRKKLSKYYGLEFTNEHIERMANRNSTISPGRKYRNETATNMIDVRKITTLSTATISEFEKGNKPKSGWSKETREKLLKFYPKNIVMETYK